MLLCAQTSAKSVPTPTCAREPLCQQTHEDTLTASHRCTLRLTLSLVCCGTTLVRAAEEYDEYVFGKRDEGEEGIERKNRERGDGGERRGLEETSDRRKERSLNEFRNWQKNSNPITTAGLSFVSICLYPSIKANAALKMCSLWKSTVAAGKNVQPEGKCGLKEKEQKHWQAFWSAPVPW